MTVFVQRPGETTEEFERYAHADLAIACKRMLEREEPTWQVWVS